MKSNYLLGYLCLILYNTTISRTEMKVFPQIKPVPAQRCRYSPRTDLWASTHFVYFSAFRLNHRKGELYYEDKRKNCQICRNSSEGTALCMYVCFREHLLWMALHFCWISKSWIRNPLLLNYTTVKGDFCILHPLFINQLNKTIIQFNIDKIKKLHPFGQREMSL